MINKIVENNLCAGCGLCQSIFGKQKISVTLDHQGFYRPTINQNLDKKETDLFSKICPGVIVKKTKSHSPKSDLIWGDIYSCFTGFATDNNIRKEASSGGVITGVLDYLLGSGKIEAVIQIGSSRAKPYLNEVKVCTVRSELVQNANSRYSPSAPLTNILEILENYHKVAFVGKPCDVSALRLYSKYNLEVKEKIKCYISFFCAGVPSLKATKDIITAMDINIEDVESLHYRKDGWPGFFKVTNRQKQQFKLSYGITWMKLLGPHIQFRCKVCADGIGHLSDIVCADAWEDFDDKGFPTFKDALGKSIVISRTKNGEKIIHEVLKQKIIKVNRHFSDYREIDKMQPGQLSKKTNFKARQLALLFRRKRVPIFSREFYFHATFRSTPTKFIKNFIGMLKRLN